MAENLNFKMNNEREKQDKAINETLRQIKNKLIVMSGKGGVGKSTLAVNLAVALSERGLKVGLMDIDFHGPNTLKMLNLENKHILAEGENILPLEYSKNLGVVSIASMLENPDTAVIWRGPLKISVIKQFIANVKWNELDWLIIDSPPGTGDEPLTVAQLIKDAQALIVTTPQEVSLMDIRKSVDFCKKINMKIVGIVENMSYLICPKCGERIEIFKTGGGKKTAEKLNLKFLGAIPMEPEIVENSDKGVPYFSKFKDSEAAKIFNKAVDVILNG